MPECYRLESCRRYVAKMPAAVSGQGGHNATFAVACVAAGTFGLDEAGIMEILLEYNQRCEPPWTERELLHKAQDALRVSECTPTFL
jgi:hypothetical protein